MRLLRTVGMVALCAAVLSAVPAAAESHLDTSEEVKLTFTSTPGNNKALLEHAAASFMVKYPNVSIEVIEYESDWYNQNAIRLFNSSDHPDGGFFWLTGFYSALTDAGVLMPLDDVYESAGLYDALAESTVEVARADDGKLYGVAMNSIMSPVLMYNKKAFAAAGITEEPKTMEELVALGPKLRAAGYIPWTSGLASASQATQLFDITIRRFTDDETYEALLAKEIVDYSHPDVLRGFQNMQLMATELMEPGVTGVKDTEARALFAQEKAAIYSDGTWNLGESALHGEMPEGFELGIMTYPPARDDVRRTTGFYDATGFVIPARATENQEWTKEYIKHLLSFENQSTMGNVIGQTPVRTDIPIETLQAVYHPDVAAIYTRVQGEGTHQIYNTIMPGAYRPAATQLIQGLVGGQLTPEQFAEEFTAMVKQIHE